MRVLVTGVSHSVKFIALGRLANNVAVSQGTGFLGSHLVESLLAQGHDVLVLDNFWTSDASSLSRLSSNSNTLEVIKCVPVPSLVCLGI